MPRHKKLKLRTRLRTTSKVQEKQLLGTAKWLAENPEAPIPECEGECRRCPFSKIATRIKFASENRENPQILRRMTKTGDQITRAYAASLLHSHEDKAPYLVVAKTPDGNIAYMHSPKVKKEQLIGIQYFRDPHLRLLAYAEIARKRRLSFYSVGDTVFCAPLFGKTPSEFIEETMRRISLTRRDDSCLKCGGDLRKLGHLSIEWRNARLSITLCESCLTDDKNTVARISERMLHVNPEECFSLGAVVKLDCDRECEKCIAHDMYEFESNDKKQYISGKISDKGVYQIAVEKFLDSVTKSGQELFILGNRCFGEDIPAMAQAISTNDLEREAIEVLLKRLSGSVVLQEDTTANKLLTQHWKEHGEAIITEMGGHPSGFTDEISPQAPPMSQIERSMSEAQALAIRGSLPTYSSLGKYASLADGIAREYKVGGAASASKAASVTGTEDTHQKAIGLAFRIALGETGIEWQYTNIEIENARHLSPMAERLLQSEGEDYDRALRELILNAGTMDEIVRSK